MKVSEQGKEVFTEWHGHFWQSYCNECEAYSYLKNAFTCMLFIFSKIICKRSERE